MAISSSAEDEEGYAPSTAPPFEKGGRKLPSFCQHEHFCSNQNDSTTNGLFSSF